MQTREEGVNVGGEGGVGISLRPWPLEITVRVKYGAAWHKVVASRAVGVSLLPP